jgi:hypothetical protein
VNVDLYNAFRCAVVGVTYSRRANFAAAVQSASTQSAKAVALEEQALYTFNGVVLTANQSPVKIGRELGLTGDQLRGFESALAARVVNPEHGGDAFAQVITFRVTGRRTYGDVQAGQAVIRYTTFRCPVASALDLPVCAVGPPSTRRPTVPAPLLGAGKPANPPTKAAATTKTATTTTPTATPAPRSDWITNQQAVLAAYTVLRQPPGVTPARTSDDALDGFVCGSGNASYSSGVTCSCQASVIWGGWGTSTPDPNGGPWYGNAASAYVTRNPAGSLTVKIESHVCTIAEHSPTSCT